MQTRDTRYDLISIGWQCADLSQPGCHCAERPVWPWRAASIWNRFELSCAAIEHRIVVWGMSLRRLSSGTQRKYCVPCRPSSVAEADMRSAVINGQWYKLHQEYLNSIKVAICATQYTQYGSCAGERRPWHVGDDSLNATPPVLVASPILTAREDDPDGATSLEPWKDQDSQRGGI